MGRPGCRHVIMRRRKSVREHPSCEQERITFFWSEKYCTLVVWLKTSMSLCDHSENEYEFVWSPWKWVWICVITLKMIMSLCDHSAGWVLGAQRCAAEGLWESISQTIIREGIMWDSLASTAGVNDQRSLKNREHERRDRFLDFQREYIFDTNSGIHFFGNVIQRLLPLKKLSGRQCFMNLKSGF